MSKEHDYTSKSWGHALEIHRVEDGGKTLHVMGLGYGVKAGDSLRFMCQDGETVYRIAELERMSNPRDAWTAKLVYPESMETTPTPLTAQEAK